MAKKKHPWADPRRARVTLESFAATEDDGGRDLQAAALRTLDAELRGHLERHARDELRHAQILRRRAAELAPPADSALSERPYDLSRGRRVGELDAHGFFNAGLFDELGEVEYVAMLHVAEQHAAKLFERHAQLARDDPATCAVFEEILRDEKYHVAYTGKILARWRGEGREREVRRALRAARGSRWLGAWTRLGARSAGNFGRALLLVLYWSLLLPFGLVASRRTATSGWSPSRSSTESSAQF